MIGRIAVSTVFAPVWLLGQPVPTLAPGAPLERQITGGEAHDYRLALGAGRSAGVAVEQRGVDAVIQTLDLEKTLVAGDTMGIHDDCKAGADVKCEPEVFVPGADEPATAGRLLTDKQEKQAAETAHLFPGKSLIDQLDEARVSWKVYMQGLPADHKTIEYAPLDANGKVLAKLYAQKHNPFVYFSSFANDPARMAKLLPDDRFRHQRPNTSYSLRQRRAFPRRVRTWGLSRRLLSERQRLRSDSAWSGQQRANGLSDIDRMRPRQPYLPCGPPAGRYPPAATRRS